MAKVSKITIFLTFFFFLFAGLIGGALGACLAGTINIMNSENFVQEEVALPTRLLDINGQLITEFASDEKREIIQLGDLPQHIIDALVSREDRIFYKHRGFSIKAVFRAVVGKITHKSMGGGSTLTQQIAGTLYCNRRDMTIMRKIKELWWAIQMERRFSKNEILEKYLNMVYFGGGTYGVNAAARYYFGHSATELTPAESAILVIQLSNPAFYNPFDYPNRAMNRQKDVLDTMVQEGYITKEIADESFNEYWAAFDYTRTSASSYYARDDKAPWFSEYVRRELSSMIYGSNDIYTSGLTVNTTLNLEHQRLAQEIMEKYIAKANRQYKNSQSIKSNEALMTYIPMTEALALIFNLGSLKVSEQRSQSTALSEYQNNINPVVDLMSLMFGIDNLKVGVVNHSNELAKKKVEKTTIEGTMISIDNATGYITALVGGSKFDSENQFIRAVQARVQPGSTFKPLYYSAAIDSRQFTATTAISDTPVVFYTQDGKPYIPQNFKGEWSGDVQLWYALAHSMNVPSLKILDAIGFDAAISRAVSLLGISDKELPSRGFVPGYPIGLGVCSVRPIEMARAFAIFANGGREVEPLAIRSIEDRNGNVILNPEKELRQKQHQKAFAAQIISPQTAFIMTQLLQETVNSGTLAWGANKASSKQGSYGSKFTYTTSSGKRFTMPAAGKTGTTQNWADAWAVGFTPYNTSAFWFGFDKPGRSLGLEITGSTLAGVAWGDFMAQSNKGLPYKTFTRPATGLVSAAACSVTGLIPSTACPHSTTHWYLEGTQPTSICQLHANSTGVTTLAIQRLKQESYQAGYPLNQLEKQTDTSPLSLDLNFLNNPNYASAPKPMTTQEFNSKTQKTQEQTLQVLSGNFLLE